MRIAMLTNNYKPFVGGVPISIERLAQGLRKLGHEVYVFAPSYEEQIDEPYVIRYRSRKKKLRGNIVIPDIMDKTIEYYFTIMTFDIIHVHHPMLVGYIAQHLSKKHKIPIVFTYHTRYEQYLHYLRPYASMHKYNNIDGSNRLGILPRKLFYNGSQKLVKIHNRVFTNRCSLVLAPTMSMKQYLEENGTITNIEVIPTGLDEEDFNYDREIAEKIREQYLTGKKYLLCTISRIEKEKNLHFLLEGLSRLKNRKGDCFRLLLIGEGSHREVIKSEVERLNLVDNIVFTGCLDHAQIRNYCRACDLFVFTSQSETQGIVILEAMAAGLPVVAIEATGVNDVVKDGWSGYITEADVNQWENKVGVILDNAMQRKWMSENCLFEAKKYLAWNIAKKVEMLYEDLLLRQGMEEPYENKIM